MKLAVGLLILLIAIPVVAEDAAGHYVLSGVMEVGSELWLKPDGKFEFMLAYGAADYWAKGTWRQEGNAVILQSDGKKEDPFRLLRSEAGKPGRIRVWVIGKDGKGVANIHVGLLAGDHPLEATTDEDGAAVFPDEPKAHAVAFEVRVYELEAGPFEIDASSNKDFYFEINGDTITQVLFESEKLPLNDGALMMTHWGAEKPMRYEKQKE